MTSIVEICRRIATMASGPHTLITTRCGIALFHVQCSMFTVFTFCVSSMYIVFTLCAIFKVHCVRTLCTLSEMQAVGFFVDKQANISCQNRRQKFAQNCEESHSVCVQGAAYWSCIHSKSVKICGFCSSVSKNLRKKCVNSDGKIPRQKCVNHKIRRNLVSIWHFY